MTQHRSEAPGIQDGKITTCIFRDDGKGKPWVVRTHTWYFLIFNSDPFSGLQKLDATDEIHSLVSRGYHIWGVEAVKEMMTIQVFLVSFVTISHFNWGIENFRE